MGSASSTVSSVKSDGSAIPMASTSNHNTKLILPSAAQAESTTYSLSSSPSQIMSEDVTLHTQKLLQTKYDVADQNEESDNEIVMCSNTSLNLVDKNCSPVGTQEKVKSPSEEKSVDDKTGKHEQKSIAELKEILKKLSLSDREMQGALKLLNENSKLTRNMKIIAECVLSFQNQSCSSSLMILKSIECMYFELNPVERIVVGDFLCYVKFCKESYAKYVSLLKVVGLEHFSDSLFDTDEEQHFEILNILSSIRNLWWNFTDSSDMFGAQILSHIDIIQEFIENIVTLTGVDGKTLNISFSFESAMGLLHNVAKLSNSRQLFRELKLVEILTKFLTYDDYPKDAQQKLLNSKVRRINLIPCTVGMYSYFATEITMLALMILAWIIDEKQTHLLTSHESVFDLMLLLTKWAWTSTDHRYDGFSVEELLQAMTGLSRNDSVKKVLVQKGILTIMLNILTEGSENLQAVSIKLLWELAFDPENRIQIQKDEVMMQNVKNLSIHANRKISRSAQGVLWVIGMGKNNKQTNVKMKKVDKLKEHKGSTGHVMISYNWSDQKELLEIRDVLKNQGYRIWMDIDNIHGSALQAMAEAVEQADIVLVCMSEKYKESLNCRSEAEYAFSLHKPIVPLLMQNEYKPDGWLGILLGMKLFFNFSGKYPFEKKIDELVKEIGGRGKLKDDSIVDTTDGPIIKTLIIPLGKTPDIHPSPQFNVQHWIEENSLSKFMNLQSLSTEHLHFLKKLSLRAPEFYYSFMLDFMSGKMSSEDLTGLMSVTDALEQIPK